MKFSMAIQKKTRVTVGRTEGHNTRLHKTKSQLPKEAWLTPKGRHAVVEWRREVLDAAKALAKRKDAVVAIEIVIQVGNQTQWRDMPTKEHPHGKPKAGLGPKLKAIVAGARQAAIREFGEQNVIGIDLHTDESSPHVHVLVAPIKDGKLNAKHWLNGARKCALLRSHIHEVVDKHIRCEYEKGAPGGKPHDPERRAGAHQGPQTPPGMFKRAMGVLSATEQVKKLKGELNDARSHLQAMFSRLKKVERDVAKEKAQKRQMELRALATERKEKGLRERVTELERALNVLRPRREVPPQSLQPVVRPNIKLG